MAILDKYFKLEPHTKKTLKLCVLIQKESTVRFGMREMLSMRSYRNFTK